MRDASEANASSSVSASTGSPDTSLSVTVQSIWVCSSGISTPFVLGRLTACQVPLDSLLSVEDLRHPLLRHAQRVRDLLDRVRLPCLPHRFAEPGPGGVYVLLVVV